MSYLVLAYPELDEADFDWIQSIRRRYDRNYRLINPHFTLVFEEEKIALKELLNQTKKAAAGFKKFSMSIKSAAMIYGPTKPIWFAFLIPDKGNGEIIRLHYELYSGIMEKNRRWDLPFIPHITVGHFDEMAECRTLTYDLNRKKIKIKGKIYSLDVVSCDGNKIKTVTRLGLL